MATVPDLSGNFPASLPSGIDYKLAKPNRIVATTPVATLTPLYAGEVVLDNVTRQLWRGMDTASNTSWTPITQIHN